MKRLAKLSSLLLLASSMGFLACGALSGVDDLTFVASPCKSASDCPTPAGACEAALCVEGVCATSLLDGVEAMTQVRGDCKVVRCRNGKEVVEVDDLDIPSTPSDCDEDICAGGVPSNPPRAFGAACSSQGGNYCNGSGACVECRDATDCIPSSNPCEQAICEIDGHCVMHPLPEHTPLPPDAQVVGDCKLWRCDGAGDKILETDLTDVEDDANDCTIDTCNGSVPWHTDREEGASCGYELTCDAHGGCTGCTIDAQCKAPQTCGGSGSPGVCGCTPKSCEDLEEKPTCGIWSDGCGGYLNCNNGEQDIGEEGVDCGGPPNCSKCGVGTSCGDDADCLSGFCVDEVCCNEKCEDGCMACSQLEKGYGKDGICGAVAYGKDSKGDCKDQGASTCGQNGTCNGKGGCATYPNGTVCGGAQCIEGQGGGAWSFKEADVCQNDACKVASWKSCSNDCNQGSCRSCTIDADCSSDEFCNEESCKTKLLLGEACTLDAACSTGHCVDGVCCEDACEDTCHTCADPKTNGYCVAVAPFQPDPGTCEAPQACDGMGACKGGLGQPCVTTGDCAARSCVDQVCCDASTCGACERCNAPGQLGSCVPVSPGASDPDSCAAPKTCEGPVSEPLSCLSPNGAACAPPGEVCKSGNCVDGFCCESTCTEACKSCGVPGSEGYCSLVPFGEADPGKCQNGGRYCDGIGQCKLGGGKPCATSADCLNDNCVDGWCCDALCNGTCQTCADTGICHDVPSGAPDDTCGAGMLCNGGGLCLKGPGLACGAGSECLSGACADGVCCDAACTDECEACDANGHCNAVTNDSDPDTCAAPRTCNASGVCESPNGVPCVSGGECASGICVDDVCCNEVCVGDCVACDLPGSVGTCSNMPPGTIDTCPTSTTCDGYGHCWKADGETCSKAFDCQSGFCTDGVCCEAECKGPCETCNLAQSEGLCEPVPYEETDDMCPVGLCDGLRQCKLDVGASCAVNADCLLGFCVDGFCCDGPCNGTCQTCAGDGICKTVTNGADMDTCAGSQVCDGQGLCKTKTGEPCDPQAACLSGHCVDDVCCKTTCAGECTYCVGNTGSCQFVPRGQKDPVACEGIGEACDGAGVCKRENCFPCSQDADCLSNYCRPVQNFCDVSFLNPSCP